MFLCTNRIHPADSHLSRTCHYHCRQIITGQVLGATIHLQTRIFFSVLPPCKLDFRRQIRLFFPLRSPASEFHSQNILFSLRYQALSNETYYSTGHSFVVLSCMCQHWLVTLGVNFTTDVLSVIVEEVPVPENTAFLESAVLPCVTCSGAVNKYGRCHFASLSGTAMKQDLDCYFPRLGGCISASENIWRTFNVLEASRRLNMQRTLSV